MMRTLLSLIGVCLRPRPGVFANSFWLLWKLSITYNVHPSFVLFPKDKKGEEMRS